MWGSVKTLFSNKVTSNVHITLSEDDQLVRNEYKIATIFNNFSINDVSNLEIKVYQHYIYIISDSDEKAVTENSCISIIKKMVSSADKAAAFSLTSVTSDDIVKKLKDLT